jgi:hypothetical protein
MVNKFVELYGWNSGVITEAALASGFEQIVGMLCVDLSCTDSCSLIVFAMLCYGHVAIQTGHIGVE